jgi:DNA-binding CsgD family transcriptional regulator
MPSGKLEIESYFGHSDDEINAMESLSMDLEIPQTVSIRRNECIILGSKEELISKFPQSKIIYNFEISWNMEIVVPIPSFGVYSIRTFQKLKFTENEITYLRLFGQLAMLAFSKSDLVYQINHKKNFNVQVHTKHELTERQKLIFQLIEKGMTNPQIAKEIGFSESLVRHETILIYSILGISGRKEVIGNSKNH